MLMATTCQHIAYLPKATLYIVALGLLNALISVTSFFFEKRDMVGFLMSGHTLF